MITGVFTIAGLSMDGGIMIMAENCEEASRYRSTMKSYVQACKAAEEFDFEDDER